MKDINKILEEVRTLRSDLCVDEVLLDIEITQGRFHWFLLREPVTHSAATTVILKCAGFSPRG